MPSPFPGMDPYLEDRALWPDVHASLITYIREALQPHIRPKYVARIGERIQLAQAPHSYIPDVFVAHRLREPAPILVVEKTLVADEPQTVIFLDEERRVPYIEIVYRETGEVVTVIEVLSPANKEGDGRARYRQKQHELLNSQASLVEIDLLAYGEVTVLAGSVTITEPADWRYLISISRPQRRHEVDFYAVPLRQRLPRCRIPLRQPDPDTVLDLPVVFSRCYDVGGYDLLIDYGRLPATPLRENEVAWLTNLLAEKHASITPP